MKALLTSLLMASTVIASLSGCAPVIVGGAAAGVAVAHDRRTTGAVIEDSAIEFKASNALYKDEEIRQQVHLNVTSFNGIVLLSGEAPTEELRARTGNIVQSVEKVRRLHNELQLAAPSSLMTRSSDTLITAKVKTRLMSVEGLKAFDLTRVKIVTENGTVFMMGLLKHVEADAAVEVGRSVSGVQRVVKLFEYLD